MQVFYQICQTGTVFLFIGLLMAWLDDAVFSTVDAPYWYAVLSVVLICTPTLLWIVYGIFSPWI